MYFVFFCIFVSYCYLHLFYHRTGFWVIGVLKIIVFAHLHGLAGAEKLAGPYEDTLRPRAHTLRENGKFIDRFSRNNDNKFPKKVI